MLKGDKKGKDVSQRDNHKAKSKNWTYGFDSDLHSIHVRKDKRLRGNVRGRNNPPQYIP